MTTERPTDAGSAVTPPVPPPPWFKQPRRPVARVPLTTDTLVETALTLLDREGLEGLSMRRLASELNVAAASLYMYVSNKDELLQLMFDWVIGEVKLSAPDPEPGHWRDQVKDFAHQMRNMLKRHRNIAQISLGLIPVGQNFLVVLEQLLAILQAGGMPGPLAAHAADLVSRYVKAFAYEESVVPRPHLGDDADPSAVNEAIHDYFSQLPAGTFPHLIALAGTLTEDNPDERFEFGLDVLLDGLVLRVNAG